MRWISSTDCLPLLVSFVAEVEEAGYVEKKLDKVMQHQKNKSQMGQATKTN